MDSSLKKIQFNQNKFNFSNWNGIFIFISSKSKPNAIASFISYINMCQLLTVLKMSVVNNFLFPLEVNVINEDYY